MSDFDKLETTLNNRSDYLANGMQAFSVKKLDGSNQVVYNGYATYSFIWEKSYVKSLARSGSGAMGNLNTYSTFKTPHLKVTYSVMTIDDYRTMMKQYLDDGNEFIVSAYDTIYNENREYKMYFATPAEPTYYTVADTNGNGVDLVGVRDYTVELIGTNNPMDDENE